MFLENLISEKYFLRLGVFMVRGKSRSKGWLANLGWKAKPISSGFFLTSIIGILVSLYVVYPVSVRYGFLLMLVSILMFIAAMVSMTKAKID